jgi:two-component system catabolic regulation response regulator CreB
MQRCVLVVEDEPLIAENIKYALETEGFGVLWKATLQDAETALKDKAFDLVILDVGLPDGNGFDFCRKFCAPSRLPVIFVTARKSEIDRVVGLEIGADDYVVKPFSPRELTARAKAVLRRYERPEPMEPVIPAGKAANILEVDDTAKIIRYHGKALVLSRYEYRLLKLLAGRPGRVFSREELMQMVWEEPESSLDRTVDAHIKKLRAKLKEVRAEEEIICTHRGMGYSLNTTLKGDHP